MWHAFITPVPQTALKHRKCDCSCFHFLPCHLFLLSTLPVLPSDACFQTDGVFPQKMRGGDWPAREADEWDLSLHKVHQDVLLGGFLCTKYSQWVAVPNDSAGSRYTDHLVLLWTAFRFFRGFFLNSQLPQEKGLPHLNTYPLLRMTDELASLSPEIRLILFVNWQDNPDPKSIFISVLCLSQSLVPPL